MKENYLAKWLNNELSEEELSEFKQTDEYASYVKILKATDSLAPPKFDIEKALYNVKSKQTTPVSRVVKMDLTRRMMRIAAAVVVFIAGAYFYMNSLDENISTAYAERSQILLPDNSKVELNADSEISYNDKNWDEQRSLSLKGEAFFKVAKGKKFTVSTPLGKVAVLGTQFNVEQRKDFFEVTCYEGLVSVTYEGKETKLPAGTSFLVIDGNSIASENVSDAEPTWIHDESSFKSIPLVYVLDELERQFNVSITTKGIDTKQLFTGSFSNTNLDLALRSISVPSKIKFNLEENNVVFYAEDTP